MTMKRELEGLAGEVDLDSPRMKRRKELPAPSEATVLPVQPSATAHASGGDAIIQGTESSNIDAGVLKDQATRLWQTVKDAVNKEYVTNHACAPLCPFSFLTVLQMAENTFQRQHMFSSFYATTLQTPLSRLLQHHHTSHLPRRHQEKNR